MTIGQSELERRAFIVENTRLVSPVLCPEIRLRLITDSCTLWHATERDLASLAIMDPYWGFCWAGGQALSRFVLDHPEVVAGKRVIDFGTGCGVGAVAAAMAGVKSVLASDIDPMAVEAAQLNAQVNGVTIETTTVDLIGDPLSGYDVLFAGDMFYDAAFAGEVLAWLRSIPSTDFKVFLADPGRGNLACAPVRPVALYKAPSDVDIRGKHLVETRVYQLEQD
jgi:predicted nicotinamide N-methyase